jgi:hypothetical protein
MLHEIVLLGKQCVVLFPQPDTRKEDIDEALRKVEQSLKDKKKSAHQLAIEINDTTQLRAWGGMMTVPGVLPSASFIEAQFRYLTRDDPLDSKDSVQAGEPSGKEGTGPPYREITVGKQSVFLYTHRDINDQELSEAANSVAQSLIHGSTSAEVATSINQTNGGFVAWGGESFGTSAEQTQREKTASQLYSELMSGLHPSLLSVASINSFQ